MLRVTVTVDTIYKVECFKVFQSRSHIYVFTMRLHDVFEVFNIHATQLYRNAFYDLSIKVTAYKL